MEQTAALQEMEAMKRAGAFHTERLIGAGFPAGKP
jgi:hypothetical protein